MNILHRRCTSAAVLPPQKFYHSSVRQIRSFPLGNVPGVGNAHEGGAFDRSLEIFAGRKGKDPILFAPQNECRMAGSPPIRLQSRFPTVAAYPGRVMSGRNQSGPLPVAVGAIDDCGRQQGGVVHDLFQNRFNHHAAEQPIAERDQPRRCSRVERPFDRRTGQAFCARCGGRPSMSTSCETRSG